MKVAVYAIALNEQAHVARFLAAVDTADVVLVADTGSTDATVAALRAGGATVHEISVQPWRFDDARNAALALVPADVDVCFSLDLDEVPDVGWRERLESKWGDATQGRFRSVASHRPDGSDGATIWLDKIHSRHGYRWVYPCHEVLRSDRLAERTVWLDLEVHHWPDRTKGRGQYLELLEQGCREFPDDARMSHLLGREYIHHRHWDQAAAELRRYIDLPSAVEPQQRSESLRLLGDACSVLGRADDALHWWQRAADEPSGLREPLVTLAQALHDRDQWVECHRTSLAALAIEDRAGMTQTAWAWGSQPHYLASVAAGHLGLHDQAMRQAELAMAAAPSDERLRAYAAGVRDRQVC